VYISRLRRKLGSAGRLLETVRGQGYRLVLSGEHPLDSETVARRVPA
jgi:DNA-binding winged helix-turn-helix (wHTH) protein